MFLGAIFPLLKIIFYRLIKLFTIGKIVADGSPAYLLQKYGNYWKIFLSPL